MRPKAAVRVALMLVAAMAGGAGTAMSGAQPEAGEPQVGPPADAPPQADPADVRSIDAIIGAFYESTAGPAGQARDWDRFRSLFHRQANLLAARPKRDGGSVVFKLTVEDFIEQNRNYFEKGGFFETEAARRVERFGNMAHVWSTFESRRTEDAPDPYVRGIYSIQLLKDGDRWALLNVYWDYEREDSPLPEKYLSTPPE